MNCQCEPHPASETFHAILHEMGELHDRKQQDYGKDDDPFANVRASEEWGMPAWVGAMVRATDKVRRLQSFAAKGELANESVIDAFNDLAVYAVIARVLYEQDDAAQRLKPPAILGCTCSWAVEGDTHIPPCPLADDHDCDCGCSMNGDTCGCGLSY